KPEFIAFEGIYSATFYGTSKSEVECMWGEGKHVIFDIDVVGGLRLKSKFPEEALAIVANPPSLDVHKDKLRGRDTDSEEKLRERYAKAEHELSYADKFDVVLDNFDLETAKGDADKLVLDFIK